MVWKCKSAVFNAPPSEVTSAPYVLTYLENIRGEPMGYWNGDHVLTNGTIPTSVMCACGQNGTCGGPDNIDPAIKCNCDLNDDVWREDSGYVSYKPDLPLTAVRGGDTGTNDISYITDRQLECHCFY